MGQNFKEKQKMPCTPYGLAVAIIGEKKEKIKNVTYTLWSGRDCHRAKKTKIEKCHARHMVWLWLSSARKTQNKKWHARHMVWP
jgi:hypothetical protein